MKIRVAPGQPLVEVGNADPVQRSHTEAVIGALIAEALGLAETDVRAYANPRDVYTGDGAYISVALRYPEAEA